MDSEKRNREAEILAHNANSIRKMGSPTIPDDCEMTPASVSKYKSGKCHWIGDVKLKVERVKDCNIEFK